MHQHPGFKTSKKTHLAFILFTFICLIPFFSCANPLQPVDSEEAQLVKAALTGRSFRQFDPSRDAHRRKAVILDFFSGIGLWAQYAEGNTALSEWEILAEDYIVEKSGSEYRLSFEAQRSVQILPTACDNCIGTSGISISIRNLFDNEKIRFKLNIENADFPRPFPIFESWTKFEEDEYFE